MAAQQQLKVPVRPLGSQGLKASAQGLGAMGMSAWYGATDEAESLATIARAVELLGVAHIDTSDVYGPFTNEQLVGRAIKGKRDQVMLATKCGIVLQDGQMSFDGSRSHVRQACEASLQRLGVDCIDLYYLHRVDPNTPVSETFAEMKEYGVTLQEGSGLRVNVEYSVCRYPLARNMKAPMVVLDTGLAECMVDDGALQHKRLWGRLHDGYWWLASMVAGSSLGVDAAVQLARQLDAQLAQLLLLASAAPNVGAALEAALQKVAKAAREQLEPHQPSQQQQQLQQPL